MAWTRRQKTTIGALLLYWPTVFVIAHIPIPPVVRAAQVSDKTLHFLVYLILTFLFWSALRPQAKVQWHRATVWWVGLIVVVYAMCDEGLQYFVAGRSMDQWDFLADVSGAAAALAILTVCRFWPAALVVTGATLYALAVFPRANLTALLPVTVTAFHFVSYAFFTLLWVGAVRQRPRPQTPRRAGYTVLFAGPVALLLVTKVSTVASGKAFEGWALVAAITGVLGVVTALSVSGWLGRENEGKAEAPPVEA